MIKPEEPYEAADGSAAGGPPDVSVVIPTHHRPEQVRRAIRSVLNQDYAGRIECIVVHDGEEIDESLASNETSRQVRVVANDTHTRGLPGARNAGLDYAGGEFVASLDDDDLWYPAKVRKQVELLRANPGTLAAGTGIVLRTPGGHESNRLAPRFLTHDQLLRGRVPEVNSSNLMMRREAFHIVGRYDEELAIGEDYDWLLRLSQHGPVPSVPEPLAWIDRSRPMWTAERWSTWALGREKLLSRHPELARDRDSAASIYGRIAFAHAASGDRAAAARWLTRCGTQRPLTRWTVATALVVVGLPVKWLQVASGWVGKSI